VWTKDHPKRLGRTGTPIALAVGEPLAVAPRDDVDAVTDALRARMTDMLHAVQERYPGAPPTGADGWWLPARLGGTAPTPEQAARLDDAEREERGRRRGSAAAS
jgi:hypothetical protein